MAESNETVDDFLSKVEELESIVKGFKSKDDDLMQESMTKADHLMAKLNIKELDDNDASDLPNTKIGFSKTSINKAIENPAENDANYEGMDQAAFMKVLEADAKERAQRRKEREKVANECKEKGNAEFKQGNYEQALAFYSQAIQSIKDNTVLYTNRAQAYIKLKKYSEALTDCDWAVRIFPNCVKAHIHTGRAQLGLKQYSKAREAYNKALECDPKLENLVKEYLDEVDRVEVAERQEEDAEAIFREGETTAMGLIEIIKRTQKPQQLPVFYSGGFRVLKSLLVSTSDRTLFRTNGGIRMLTEHETLSQCLSASPKSLSQEQLDMLCSAFEMYTEACRENDKNTEDFIQTQDLPQNCIKFVETKLKGQGKILKLAIIHCLFIVSQSDVGQTLIISSFDVSKLLTVLFTFIRNDPNHSSSAAGILNNLALHKKFKTLLRDKVDETVSPAFELLLNEDRAITILPVCINMVTNLTGDKCIRTKLTARKQLWDICSEVLEQHKDRYYDIQSSSMLESILGLLYNLTSSSSQTLRESGKTICRRQFQEQHKDRYFDIQSSSMLESILGLLYNLTSSSSQNLRESGKTICDSCLCLLNDVNSGILLLRCLGVMSNILPNCIPAVDLVVEKGGTDLLLKYVKSGTEEEMRHSLKGLTACTQINEQSRKTVVDNKGLGNLIKLLKSDDETVVGNAALCLSHCTQVKKVCAALTKTDIIKELLVLARDGKRPGVQQNCAILIAKLAQGDQKHLERLRELHGIEILHSCMKFIK